MQGSSQVALVVKNLPASAGDIRDHWAGITGLGRSPEERHGHLLKYSCLENPMNRGTWWATVHRVSQSQTQLKQLSMQAGIMQASASWLFQSVKEKKFTLLRKNHKLTDVQGFVRVQWEWSRGSQLNWCLEGKITFLTITFIKSQLLRLPCSPNCKESSCNAGDQGSVLALGRSSGEGYGNPLQYSCLENPMDRGAWRATVHGVTKSRTQLSNWYIQVSPSKTSTLLHCLQGAQQGDEGQRHSHDGHEWQDHFSTTMGETYAMNILQPIWVTYSELGHSHSCLLIFAANLQPWTSVVLCLGQTKA